VQQPHPPIFLGGTAPQVFQRTVAYGNGWMPTRSTPELIQQGRAILNELALDAGRDPTSLTILAYLVPADRTALQSLAAAGADAAVVRLEGDSEAAALAQLERLAQQVL
jgi:alkanesulfonate monooxygenase SsuD/methylene tetrahydromethanopterin reductase-like flavin-dependent oxidoreductase (luciferase family)